MRVITAAVSIARGRFHLEGALTNLQDGDVKGAAAQVIDGNRLLALLIQAVGQRGRGRLIDDAQHVQAGNGAGVFGGLPLCVVEVGGNRNHGIGHRIPDVGLGVRLKFLQNHSRNLFRPVLFASHLHHGFVVLAFGHFIGLALGVLFHG